MGHCLLDIFFNVFTVPDWILILIIAWHQYNHYYVEYAVKNLIWIWIILKSIYRRILLAVSLKQPQPRMIRLHRGENQPHHHRYVDQSWAVEFYLMYSRYPFCFNIVLLAFIQNLSFKPNLHIYQCQKDLVLGLNVWFYVGYVFYNLI